MGLITFIIFGALVGWLASKVMNTDNEQGGLMNILVGVVGAFIGGVLASAMGGTGVTGFNLASMFWALLGSVVVLAIYKLITKK